MIVNMLLQSRFDPINIRASGERGLDCIPVLAKQLNIGCSVALRDGNLLDFVHEYKHIAGRLAPVDAVISHNLEDKPKSFYPQCNFCTCNIIQYVNIITYQKGSGKGDAGRL